MERMLAYPAMKRLLLAVAAAPALAALAVFAAAAADAPSAGTFSVTLEPQGMHEECARLAAGEKRGYSWRADGPVDFNVHYHRGDAAVYPVKRDAMRGDGGTFTAKSAQDYCWMWTARDRPVKLDGRIAK
jgi:hypothetical protein